jgi:hypothetical protein
MEKRDMGRVLARRLAKGFTPEELRRISAAGTSFVGTGCSDAQGRSLDLEGRDCVEGPDTYEAADNRC